MHSQSFNRFFKGFLKLIFKRAKLIFKKYGVINFNNHFKQKYRTSNFRQQYQYLLSNLCNVDIFLSFVLHFTILKSKNTKSIILLSALKVRNMTLLSSGQKVYEHDTFSCIKTPSLCSDSLQAAKGPRGLYSLVDRFILKNKA